MRNGFWVCVVGGSVSGTMLLDGDQSPFSTQLTLKETLHENLTQMENSLAKFCGSFVNHPINFCRIPFAYKEDIWLLLCI